MYESLDQDNVGKRVYVEKVVGVSRNVLSKGCPSVDTDQRGCQI